MKPASRASGFTLAEMLVVLALMSMVLAVSLPYARNAGEAQLLQAEARKIGGLLGEARVAALATNRDVVARFDLDRQTVEIVDGSRRLQVPQIYGLQVLTAAGEVSDRTAGVRFFPEGGSTGGRITLNHGSSERVIAVNWLTGAVVIEEGGNPQ